MHKEKIERLQADLNLKTDEVKKLKARITSMKNQMAKMDVLNKKPVQIVLNSTTPIAQINEEDVNSSS